MTGPLPGGIGHDRFPDAYTCYYSLRVRMNELQRIRTVLVAMRRRALVRAAVQTAGFGLAAMLLALLVLSASAATVGPAGFWPILTALVLAILGLGAMSYGVLRPARILRGDRAAARLVARLHPAVSSDLVSAVELGDEADGGAAATTARRGGGAEVSPALVRALQGTVAGAVEPLDPSALISMRPARTAIGALVLAAAVLGIALRLSPDLSRGLATLTHRPTRFEGAAISVTPLVGDLRISYEYPAYTGLPPRVVDGSTGDILAVKGTKVRMEARPLHRARKALLLLGEEGEKGELPAKLAAGVLSVELTLMESGSYRFWLSPLLGRPVRELRSHRLTAEADAPPRVEIFGPADRLELPTPRPIEIGYTADDDYGLGGVELVYRIGEQPEQRQLLRDAHGARTAQGRTVWDPTAAGGLLAGQRIAYRIEAKDRDEVSGAKIGSSRTLYVIIQNPHENIEDRLDRQREVLEKLVADLANRLEQVPPAREAVAAGDIPPRVAALLTLHEAEESHLALLGRLLDDDRREGNLSKALRATLAGIADRLEHVLRDEAAALGPPRGHPGAGKPSPLPAAASWPRIATIGDRHTAELEKDVLLMDDLIGRQRLEDLAMLGRELTDAHQRLQDLLGRYKATKDEALRRQLEREMRDLRARIADLAQKIAAIKGRNDVPEEWRNMPDMKALADQAKKLDDLLEKGDEAGLAKALAELGENLKSLRQMLDQNLEGFGAERFPQENRVVAELMKKIGDLEGDERSLQKETQGLSDRQEAEVERRLKGQLDEFLKKENEKVERLKQRLSGIPTGDPESALSEEVERARDSAKQMKRLFAERDLAEAKGEAERATSSLDRATEHAGEGGEEAEGSPNAKRKRGRMRPGDAEALGEARGIAQEIADDLEKILPRPSEMLSPEEREQARAQAERQNAIGNRTDETAGEAARRLGKMPGLEKAESDLKGAAQRMRQAAEMLKKSESKSAAGAERDAAERLAKLRDSLQERSMGSGKQHRDPVRIPGADESTAPRAWRQELMDAMKEKAPERFRDEVRRYYEDLVR
jgi:hypothetical protein